MKQTAVEYIAKELSKQIDNNLFMEVTFNKLLEQALEMEKQQQCYSEEEVIDLLAGFSDFTNAKKYVTFKAVQDWFEQFKKK